ncbi:hypothetical protein [Henriciella aquimarina]|uniref:hypothetical protein n=1 Tax=Henriciella aquimarina TaxID=545261 RepID=UPI000A00B054|nr:hypothetical protein [Henriciella aquimarina]
MKQLAFLTGVMALGLITGGCTNGASQRASLSNGAQIVHVTPEIRADLKQQGLDPDEEVCKREDQIGSTIPKRICATRAMWAARTSASQGYTSDIQRDALRTRDPNAGT